MTSEDLRKLATDEYPWHPIDTVLEAADTIDSLTSQLKNARDAFDSVYATDHRRHAGLSQAIGILRRCRATCSPARIEEIDNFLAEYDPKG